MSASSATTPPLDQGVLASAFARFMEAGQKLEERYEALRKESEDLRVRLKEKDAEIARSARLATLGETAAALAHEIRNPLGSIRLFASLLKDDLNGNNASLELIEGIEKSLSTLDHVVCNILQFSRKKPLTLAPINIHSVIQDAVRSVLPQGGRDLRIAVDLAGSPFVNGDEHSMRQVFHNLLLNAMQAMKYNGDIRVSSASVGGSLLIEIRDSGPGIPAELIEQVFEPFVTSKNEGTGLGLAIVRQIVRQHGGRIEARNNRGAVFTIELPQGRGQEE